MWCKKKYSGSLHRNLQPTLADLIKSINLFEGYFFVNVFEKPCLPLEEALQIETFFPKSVGNCCFFYAEEESPEEEVYPELSKRVSQKFDIYQNQCYQKVFSCNNLKLLQKYEGRGESISTTGDIDL